MAHPDTHPRFARQMAPLVAARLAQYPVLTLTGPRQSGKTTLARSAAPHLPYANLERPDVRAHALQDAAGFLAQFPHGAVLDEVQRAPELLSWLQADVDEHRRPGRWLLTGSHQFDLLAGITQTLAGRTALLHLWPLSLAELAAGGITPRSHGLDTLLLAGGYPRIHADGLEPATALGDYFATYVERDLRQLIELRQLEAFRRFVQLAAGRVGQLLNLSALGADAGVSAPTAQAWMSLLEAGYIVHRLPPWHASLCAPRAGLRPARPPRGSSKVAKQHLLEGKRLVKQHKLYFCDVGLAAWLIGLREVGQVATHPLRGALVENLVVNEFAKHALNQGIAPGLHFYRDSNGVEVDLLVPYGVEIGKLGLVEIKAGQTVQAEWLKPMARVAGLLGLQVARQMLVHGGTQQGRWGSVELAGLLVS